MCKIVKCPQKWHVTDIPHLLLVASTPLGTFLFKKTMNTFIDGANVAGCNFFRLGAYWGDQQAAGGRMSVTP